MYGKLAKVYNKNTSSTHEIMKKEDEIYASLGITSQTAKIIATVCDK